MFKKWLFACVLTVVAGIGFLLPPKADAQVFFPRVRNRIYWGPPAVRYYDYGGGYYPGYSYRPYWGTYRYYWYPY